MWRAGDREGLDMLAPKRRSKAAELKLLGKLLKSRGAMPDEIATDGVASCACRYRMNFRN